jgi:hypothetical protein
MIKLLRKHTNPSMMLTMTSLFKPSEAFVRRSKKVNADLNANGEKDIVIP